MKKPKLALIPSAYADGKVISVMPTNGSGDFDFTRGSGATRINKDGLIETMAEELGDELISNGNFAADSDWIKDGSWSISGGSADCDGTQTSLAYLQQSGAMTSGLRYKATYEVKSVSAGEVRLFVGNVSSEPRTSTGVYTDYITASNSSFWIRGSANFIGSIDNVSVKEVLSGFDTPRLEYPMIDGVVSGCPSLLLEPQRTNLVTYSEDFSDSSWVSSGTNPPVLTPYQFISPDGTQNASRLEIPITNTTSILQQLFSHTIGQEYTVSAYVKSNSISNQEFKLYGDYGSPTGISGVLIATSEWQRFTFTYTATGTGSRSGGFYYVPNTNTDIQIYGFQAEEGSYSTSYIPTSGSETTRLAETCNNSGDASTFNDSEGVLMFEGSFLSATSSPNRRISISDGTTSNRILIQNIGAFANRLQFYTIVNNVTSTDVAINVSDITSFNKIAFKYKENDFSVWFNGIEVLTDISGATFSNGTLTELAFDGGDGNNPFYGNTKQLQYFQTALTDSELEELTSWDSFKVMAQGQLYTIE